MAEIGDKRWGKLLELLAIMLNISYLHLPVIYSERLDKVYGELEKEVRKAEKGRE